LQSDDVANADNARRSLNKLNQLVGALIFTVRGLWNVMLRNLV